LLLGNGRTLFQLGDITPDPATQPLGSGFELDQQKSQFRTSIESKVENPLGTIESFNKQFQLGEKENCYAMGHAPCAMRFSIQSGVV